MLHSCRPLSTACKMPYQALHEMLNIVQISFWITNQSFSFLTDESKNFDPLILDLQLTQTSEGIHR